jgi:uncharacterized protein YcbX
MLPADTRSKFGNARDEGESDIERKAGAYAIRLSYWHRKFRSPGKRSAPDRIFANRFGFVMFLEFKSPGKKPTALQLDEHAAMRANGLIVYVVDNLDAAKALLDKHALD